MAFYESKYFIFAVASIKNQYDLLPKHLIYIMMLKIYSLSLGLLLLVCSCQNVTKSKLSGDGDNEWIELFDGTNTDHWRGFHMDHFPDSGWYVENNELRNDGSGAGGLITREEYSSFILEWE